MTIQLNHVTKTYTQDIVLDDITLKITDGEHIAIVGENGCGKSTLLKVIAGLETIQEGEVLITKNTRVAYLNQMFDAYEGNVLSYLMEAHEDIIKLQLQLQDLEAQMAKADGHELEKILDKYGRLQARFESMDGYQVMVTVEQIACGLQIEHLLQSDYQVLSGGEKTRVNLAKQLLMKPDVLLLDEPTNHLDFVGIRWLENYILNLKETVIIVSHDRYFLDRICDKLFVFQNGNVQQFIGGYSAYMELGTAKEKKEKKKVERVSQQQLRMSSKEKQELEHMEEDIAALQEQLEHLDIEMNAAGDDFKKIQELADQRDILEQSIEEKMERWMFLEDKKQEIENAKGK